MSRPQPRLLALPGTLCAPLVFDPLARELAGEATVVGWSWMTQPGPWDLASVAARAATALRERPGVVVGHSTGGAIALELALSRPDLVRGLVLIDSGASMGGHGDVDGIIARLEAGDGPAIHAAVVDRSFAAPLPTRVRDRMLAYAASVPTRAVVGVLRSQRETDFSPRLAGIGCPTLVLHGSADAVRPLEHARRLVACIPGARLAVVEAGHSPMYEQPGEVAREIRGLLTAASLHPD